MTGKKKKKKKKEDADSGVTTEEKARRGTKDQGTTHTISNPKT